MTSLVLFLLAVIFYTYFGYLIAVLFLGMIFKRKVAKLDFEPKVAFVVAAYNEEKNIEEKILNTLSLDYSRKLMKVYIVSDGSTDGTDSIVNNYADLGVELIHVPGRVGKTEARNRALRQIKEEIIIFSDATTVYQRDAVRKLIRNFADPEVGMVTGHLIYRDSKKSQIGFGQKLYWKYESLIKKSQTNLGTLTGSVGCITAFRKKVYTNLPANIIEDFTEPLMVIQKGYRVVYEEDAICFEETTSKSSNEWKMRVRVIRGGMTGLLYAKSVLNPIKYPGASFQLISHKVLRWLMPVFGIGLFIATVAGLAMDRSNLILNLVFLSQLAFYLIALLAFTLERVGNKSKLLGISLYFLVVNAASLVALLKTMTVRLEPTWETQRESV